MTDTTTDHTNKAASAPTPPNVADIEEALRDVVDPELGINVVDLGLIYGVTVDQHSHVIIDMTLTSGPEYDQSRREPLNRAAATPAASAFEVRQGDEGEPIDKDGGANPFVPEARGNRGLRPRGGNRFRRDEEARDGEAAVTGASEAPRAAPREGGLDPSMLPPALGPRIADRDESSDRAEPQQATEPAIDAAEAAPAPRRRGRPRKNPLPVAEGSTEVLNG